MRKGRGMEDPIVEQFFKDFASWRPDEKSHENFLKALKKGQTPEDHQEAFAEGLAQMGLASYGFMETVHELSTLSKLDSKVFVQHLARTLEAVEGLRKSRETFRKAFEAYHTRVQGDLTRAHFDTQYYDAIQNFDVKSALKYVLQDVDLVLRSFSLVSAEMAGVKCLELYEDCVRFHLYLHYLQIKKPMSLEECWSILFDMNGLFSKEGDEDPESELEEFREDLEEVRREN